MKIIIDIKDAIAEAIKTKNFDLISLLFLSAAGIDNLEMRMNLSALMGNIFIAGENAGLGRALDIMKK